MQYQRRPRLVSATRLTAPLSIDTNGGLIHGIAEDWLLMYDGGVEILTDKQFKAEYEPVKAVNLTHPGVFTRYYEGAR